MNTLFSLLSTWCKYCPAAKQGSLQCPNPPQQVRPAVGRTTVLQFLSYFHNRIWNLLASLLRVGKEHHFVSETGSVSLRWPETANCLECLRQPPEVLGMLALWAEETDFEIL